MEYTGKLYGRLNNKYFDTSHTTEEWDIMKQELEQLSNKVKNLTISNVIIPECDCNDLECCNGPYKSCRKCGKLHSA